MKILVVFWENISCGEIWYFCHLSIFDSVRLALSQIPGTIISTVRTWFLSWLLQDPLTVRASWGSLNSHDMISQLSNYIKNTVQKYYVIFMCRGQYSTQGCMVLRKRIFLRICYEIFFECNCPSILKTDSLSYQGNTKYLTTSQILWCCVAKLWSVQNWRLSAR